MLDNINRRFKMSDYKLLSVGNDAKTIKGNGDEYMTAILYMKSYKTFIEELGKTVNPCAFAEQASCHEGCLVSAGRGKMHNVQSARERKLIQFYTNRTQFMADLQDDIDKFTKRCLKNGQQPCVRLNGTTDIMWEKFGIIQDNPLVQFYDYTKIYTRVYKELPSNYHLTLSYSEANMDYAKNIAKACRDTGTNMAVVFTEVNPQSSYMGMEVIDGDRDDLRFKDKKGVIIGLKAKGDARHDTSGFVIGNAA